MKMCCRVGAVGCSKQAARSAFPPLAASCRACPQPASAACPCRLGMHCVAALLRASCGLGSELQPAGGAPCWCAAGRPSQGARHAPYPGSAASGPAAPAGGRSRDFTDPLRSYESQRHTLPGILRWLRRSFHPFPPPGLRHNQLPITGIMVGHARRSRGGSCCCRQPSGACPVPRLPRLAAASEYHQLYHYIHGVAPSATLRLCASPYS